MGWASCTKMDMPSRPCTMSEATHHVCAGFRGYKLQTSMFKFPLLCSCKLSSHADPGTFSKFSEDARREEKAGAGWPGGWAGAGAGGGVIQALFSWFLEIFFITNICIR